MQSKKRFKKQKGASILILALIISTLTAITVLGATKLTIEEKKRTKSTAISAEAYRKADEAAECALWGRNATIETCSDPNDPSGFIIDTGSRKGKYFPKNITDYYCTSYEEEIKLFHILSSTGTPEETPACAGPLWTTKFSTEGEEESANILLEEESTKKRGIGVTVHISNSSIFKPFVCCNKIAEEGKIKNSIRSECNATELTNDNGPGDDPLNPQDRGWLETWPSCLGPCVSETCAYYNISLDDGFAMLNPPNPTGGIIDCNDENKEFDATVTGNSHTYDKSECQGAHWCWTDNLPQDTSPFSPGSMCDCLGRHSHNPLSAENEEAAKEDLNYWLHPDIIENEVCSPCNRIYIEEAGNPLRTKITPICGGEGEIGIWCLNLWEIEQKIIANDPSFALPGNIDKPTYINYLNKIWGTGGMPPDRNSALRLALGENRQWMCNCREFYQHEDNRIWCNLFCTAPIPTGYVWCTAGW